MLRSYGMYLILIFFLLISATSKMNLCLKIFFLDISSLLLNKISRMLHELITFHFICCEHLDLDGL